MSNMARDQCPHCTSPCNKANRYFECVVCQQRYHRNCYDVVFRNDDPHTFICHRCMIANTTQRITQLEATLQAQSPPPAVVSAAYQVADAATEAAAATYRAAAAALAGGEAATAAGEAAMAAAAASTAAARLRALLAQPPSFPRDE